MGKKTERKKHADKPTNPRPAEMDFMDDPDPFTKVAGKKELKNGGGMIKESVVPSGREDL